MKNILTDEQFISLLDVLEEGDKSFTQASYRDQIMTAHTDMLFELGIRDVTAMEAGWKSFGGLQNNFRGEISSIYGKFQAGTLNTAQATAKFKNILKTYGKDAFMSGTQMVGNSYYKEVGMTTKDKAFINKYVRAETRHWRKFLGDIKDPKHLPVHKIPRDKLGRLKSGYRRQVHPYKQRLGYYSNSLRGMGFNGMVAGAGTLLSVFWRLDKLAGRRSDHCDDCMRIAGGNPYSWKTLPTVPRGGDTQCLYRCYCGLEIQQRQGKGKQFDAPGSASTQGLQAPNRWAKIFDKFGRQIGGSPLQDIEDIYQQMYKSRQMIEITKGQERLNWIRMRQQANSALVNQYPQYRKLPLVSVKDLVKSALAARPPGGVLLKNFGGLTSRTPVTFLRGDYFANGKLVFKNGRMFFKDATGIELVANLETDIIWSLKDAGYGKAEWRTIAKKVFNREKLTLRQIKALDAIMKMETASAQVVLKKFGMTRMEMLEKIAKAREQVLKGISSKSQHFNKSTGVWSTERQVLHDKIVEDFLAQVKASRAGKAEFIMTGGRPGSGKSTVLNKIMPGWKGKYIRVDSDMIKQMLAKADGYSKLGFRAALYHEEANSIAYKIMELASRQNKNILFDQTMKSVTKAEKWMKHFKKSGYKVKGIFAELPTDKAIERAIYRFYDTTRFVDPAYIMTHGTKNMNTFNHLKKYMNEWYHYNTNVPFGTDPILVAKWKEAIARASEKYIKRAVYVDGKVSAGTVTRIKKGLLKLPTEHLSLLKELHIQDGSSFAIDATAVGGTKHDSGYYVKRGRPSRIGNIYLHEHDMTTVFHEVAHRVWDKGMTWTQKNWWIEKFELMCEGGLKAPTSYAHRSVGEFFAECYAHHYQPPKYAYYRPARICSEWFETNFYVSKYY